VPVFIQHLVKLASVEIDHGRGLEHHTQRCSSTAAVGSLTCAVVLSTKAEAWAM
jgi:hypothetical protein